MADQERTDWWTCLFRTVMGNEMCDATAESGGLNFLVTLGYPPAGVTLTLVDIKGDEGRAVALLRQRAGLGPLMCKLCWRNPLDIERRYGATAQLCDECLRRAYERHLAATAAAASS